jgi:hypothetical protein
MTASHNTNAGNTNNVTATADNLDKPFKKLDGFA